MRVRRARKCFRIKCLQRWACSSAGRAPALQVSSLNHTSAASGVAYADARGVTSLSNWTDVGLNSLYQQIPRATRRTMRLYCSACGVTTGLLMSQACTRFSMDTSGGYGTVAEVT